MKKILENISLPKLLLGMLVTGFCALGIHSVLLETFSVPYPHIKIENNLATYFSRGFFHILALIFLNALMPRKFKDASIFLRSTVIFLLSTTLTEALFRIPFMDSYCTSSVFPFITNLPKLTTAYVVAVMVVASTQLVSKLWQKCITALIFAAINIYALPPLFDKAYERLIDSMNHLASNEWCKLPYGWDVNIPADLTFVEPVFASFTIAALVWDRLSAKPAIRIIQFVFLIMFIRRQVFAAFIYMVYSGQPYLLGLASMGQFTLEALLLGLLTALTWKWSKR
jgi:hypothetical protein